MERRVCAMPDVGETDAAVETKEEEEREVDVHEEEPGNNTVEVKLGGKIDSLAQHRPHDPDREVADDQEREGASPRHLGRVFDGGWVASHPEEDQDSLYGRLDESHQGGCETE